MAAAESIALGVITNAVYDITKYVISVFVGDKYIKREDKIKYDISLNIKQNFPYECQTLKDSGTIELFLSSPQMFDIINSYLVYKIIGIQKEKTADIKKKLKKQKETLTINDLVVFLSNNLLNLYQEKDALIMPDKEVLNKFFEFIIECSEETIFIICI